MRYLSILLVCLFLSATVSAQQQERYSRAKIHLDAKKHTISDLARLGIAVDHGQHKKNTFFISDLSAHEIKAARKAGFKVDILIKDVSKYYRDQNKPQSKSGQKTTAVTRRARSFSPGHLRRLFYLYRDAGDP